MTFLKPKHYYQQQKMTISITPKLTKDKGRLILNHFGTTPITGMFSEYLMLEYTDKKTHLQSFTSFINLDGYEWKFVRKENDSYIFEK